MRERRLLLSDNELLAVNHTKRKRNVIINSRSLIRAKEWQLCKTTRVNAIADRSVSDLKLIE